MLFVPEGPPVLMRTFRHSSDSVPQRSIPTRSTVSPPTGARLLPAVSEVAYPSVLYRYRLKESTIHAESRGLP